MKSKCQICGSTKSFGGGLCQHLCYWILEGWLGFNARTKETAVMDQRALRFADVIISYPKLIASARILGWAGRETAVTFTATKAEATKAEAAMAEAAKAGAR